MNYHTSLQILDLPEFPSPEIVKKAFRNKALLYHPDRNTEKQATLHFRQCVEAYEFLVEYYKENPWAPKISKEPEKEKPLEKVDWNIEDIFDDIFGFTREDRILGYQKPQPVFLTQKEWDLGVTKEIKLLAYEKCESCKGLGSEGKTHSSLCTYCFGQGKIETDRSETKTCPRCEGRGRNIEKNCVVCAGFGRLSQNRKMKVTFPPGFKVGGTYTLHGEDLKTGKKLDLFISPCLKTGFFENLKKFFSS